MSPGGTPCRGRAPDRSRSTRAFRAPAVCSAVMRRTSGQLLGAADVPRDEERVQASALVAADRDARSAAARPSAARSSASRSREEDRDEGRPRAAGARCTTVTELTIRLSPPRFDAAEAEEADDVRAVGVEVLLGARLVETRARDRSDRRRYRGCPSAARPGSSAGPGSRGASRAPSTRRRPRRRSCGRREGPRTSTNLRPWASVRRHGRDGRARARRRRRRRASVARAASHSPACAATTRFDVRRPPAGVRSVDPVGAVREARRRSTRPALRSARGARASLRARWGGDAAPAGAGSAVGSPACCPRNVRRLAVGGGLRLDVGEERVHLPRDAVRVLHPELVRLGVAAGRARPAGRAVLRRA